MNGMYTVRVKTNKLSYEIKINRKITIIRGDSATGKTTLIKLLQESKKGNLKIRIESSVGCHILDKQNWELYLKETSNKIIFIDEEHKFMTSLLFSRLLKESDNYFVIISRYDYPSIPYSIDSIYQIKNSNRVNLTKNMYSRKEGTINAEALIVEDSKSGLQFFRNINNNCYSSEGNSNIIKSLVELVDYKKIKDILIIIDSAAYGAYINGLIQVILDKKVNIKVFAPECFEYLLLRSKMFGSLDNIEEIVNKPYEYCTKLHFTWENYYEDLIKQVTIGCPASYKKSELSKCYINDCCYLGDKCCYYSRGNKLKMIVPDKIEILDLI